MSNAYDDLDEQTRSALQTGPDALRAALSDRAEIFATNDEMIRALAAYILQEMADARAAGKKRAAMIVPVGPVGQYQLVAETCMAGGQSLDRLTLIVMDEYLDDAGRPIDPTDPLSFRGHMERAFAPMPDSDRPRIVVPDPGNTDEIGQVIDDHDGLDAAFAGVGITGHLAFNDPLPGVTDDTYFADLPTRVVALSPETRLINSVTAARGNLARIPRLAVTVGMREILAAARIRIFMNRDWQCAAIRKLALGPVTAAFPASLVRRHPNWSLHVVESVLDLPEPELR